VVFLSSTGGGVIAIAKLEGRTIGGRPPGTLGPVTAQLQHAYWALHDDPRLVESVVYT
jgi:branched-subunit amino acid aminotransferase/4-amino-4-deoxychorismate lyase